MMKDFIVYILICLCCALSLHAVEYRINAVSILSNERTHNEVIMQELSLHSQDTFSNIAALSNAVETSKQKLYNLDLFSSVEIKLSIQNDTNRPSVDVLLWENKEEYITNAVTNRSVDVTVVVKDKWTFMVLPTYYYQDLWNSLLGASIIDGNFLGVGNILMLNISLGIHNLDMPPSATLCAYHQIKRFLGSTVDIGMAGYIDIYANRVSSYGVFCDTSIRYEMFTVPVKMYAGVQYEYYTASYYYDSNYYTYNVYDKYYGGGIELGRMNRYRGAMWGDRNIIAIYNVNNGIMGELSHSKYFRIFQNTCFGYTVFVGDKPRYFSFNDERFLISSRNDISAYGSFYLPMFVMLADFLPHIFTIPGIFETDVYIPLFINYVFPLQSVLSSYPLSEKLSIIRFGFGLRLVPINFGWPGLSFRIDIGFQPSEIKTAPMVIFYLNDTF